MARNAIGEMLRDGLDGVLLFVNHGLVSKSA